MMNDNSDHYSIMYFQSDDAVENSRYCVAVDRNGQVFYCGMDDNDCQIEEWKRVSLDFQLIGKVH